MKKRHASADSPRSNASPSSPTAPGALGEQGGLWDKITGGAFGMGISANIRELYLFLVQNYHPRDQIFLFGYSRGAYTVRSVGGLIRNCGILRPQHVGRVGEAYAWPDAPIELIGVWDTVGALGIPVTPLRFWTKPHEKTPGRPKFSCPPRRLQAARIRLRPSCRRAAWSRGPHPPRGA